MPTFTRSTRGNLLVIPTEPERQLKLIATLFNKLIQNKYHDLKIWSQYYTMILDGSKPWEIRKNDRNFQKGDLLRLNEYNPETEKYTNRKVVRVITNVVTTAPGLMEGYCILSTSKLFE